MKALLAAALVLAPFAAQAAAPEADYLAARNGYIAKIKKLEKAGGESAALDNQQTQAMADLEKRLRAIIGERVIEGFPAKAKFNVETLSSGDVGFGALDGLSYASEDGRTMLVATTRGLLTDWLREHKNWWRAEKNAPQSPAEAALSEAFYTPAISADAAVVKYADIPVSKPADVEIAGVVLSARTQDQSPSAPEELLATVVSGARVYVVAQPLHAKFPPIAACDALVREAHAKSEKAGAAKTAHAFDDAQRIGQQGERAFRDCFRKHAPEQAAFAQATAQAQALVEKLSAK